MTPYPLDPKLNANLTNPRMDPAMQPKSFSALKRSFFRPCLHLLLFALFWCGSSSLLYAQEFNVTWTDAVQVIVDGNTMKKDIYTGWSGGAASTATFSGNGGVDFTVPQTTASVMCGLSYKNTDAGYGTIDYALSAVNTGEVQIYEQGIYRGTFATYQTGDHFRIERVGGAVYYKKNGAVIYSSTVPSSGTLLVDSSLYHADGVLADAKMVGVALGVPSPITDLRSTNGNSGEVRLTWGVPANNGAVVTGYEIQYGTVASGGFGSVYTDDATPGATIIGLTNDVPYQFRVIAKNSYGASVSSNVVNVTPAMGFLVSWTDAVVVSVDGNSITKTAAGGWISGAASVGTFGEDGGVDFTVPSITMHSMCGLSYKNTDASNSTIDYALNPMSDGKVQVFEKGVSKGIFGSYQPHDRFRVERIGSMVYYKRNGIVIYTSTVPSVGKLLVDSSLYLTGSVIANAKVVNVIPGVPDAVTDIIVSGGDTAVQLLWSEPANNSGAITGYDIQYGTVASGTFGSAYTDDAVPGATITGLTNGMQYQFRVVAKNSYGSSGYSNISITTPAANIPVIWTDAVGVSVSGNSITKTGTVGWNSGAASTVSFGGNGGVDFTVTPANVDLLCGLSSKNPDASYATLDYALYAKSGGSPLQVYEKGVLRGTFGA